MQGEGAAAGALFSSNVNQGPSNYWTPDKIRSAQPMPFPQWGGGGGGGGGRMQNDIYKVSPWESGDWGGGGGGGPQVGYPGRPNPGSPFNPGGGAGGGGMPSLGQPGYSPWQGGGNPFGGGMPPPATPALSPYLQHMQDNYPGGGGQVQPMAQAMQMGGGQGPSFAGMSPQTMDSWGGFQGQGIPGFQGNQFGGSGGFGDRSAAMLNSMSGMNPGAAMMPQMQRMQGAMGGRRPQQQQWDLY